MDMSEYNKSPWSEADYPHVQEAVRAFPGMDEYDLTDFSSTDINMRGELEVMPQSLTGEVYVDLKATILSIAQLTLSDVEASHLTSQPRYAYVVRNLATDRPHAAVILDDQQVGIGMYTESEDSPLPGYGELHQGQTLVIGKTTTPELKLPDEIDEEHFRIRIGSLQGHLHLADLYSSLGTKVYLPNDTVIGCPRVMLLPLCGRMFNAAMVGREWPLRPRPTTGSKEE